MKKYLKKFMTLICTMVIIIGFSIHEIHALPYYDLKFEERCSKIVKGEYEKLGENINLDKDTEMTININIYGKNFSKNIVSHMISRYKYINIYLSYLCKF